MTIALQINKYHLRTFGNEKVNEEFTHLPFVVQLSKCIHAQQQLYLSRSLLLVVQLSKELVILAFNATDMSFIPADYVIECLNV